MIYYLVMMATAHTLVAGAIAARISDPTSAAGLAFVSHFLMDALPHWDIGTNWRSRPKRITGLLAIAETILGISLAYFLFARKVAFFPLTVALVSSLLPDWLETPWYIFFAHQKKHQPPTQASLAEKLAYTLYKTQGFFHTKTQFPLGVITQIVTVLFFFRLLL